MIIKKEVEDLVLVGPQAKHQNPCLWPKEIKKDCIAVGIAQQIIRKGVSN